MIPPDWTTMLPVGLTSAQRAPGPVAPVGPGGPTGPRGPAGSWFAAKSTRRSEPFFTFVETTALLRSWRVPTLLGASAVTAATLVPPNATNRATAASTVAGDRRLDKRMHVPPIFGFLLSEACEPPLLAGRLL